MAGSEAQYGPRLAGEILKDYLKKSNEPFARAYRAHTSEVEAEKQGWHPNTELGVDVKTLLRSDVRLKAGRNRLLCQRLNGEMSDSTKAGTSHAPNA